MIRRFYVHNFRCLDNFELSLGDRSSVLLIGKNGAGKSSVRLALEVLQRIARGVSRVSDLVSVKDLTRGRSDVPMRFEIEATLGGLYYKYSIAFDHPAGFKEMRVVQESLITDGKPVFTRQLADVTLGKPKEEPDFLVAWYLAALPIVQERDAKDPLFIFKQWLARIAILQPIPSLIKGDSERETLHPDVSGGNFAEWFSGLIAHAPSAYATVDRFLKQVMPDLKDIKNPLIGKNTRSLEMHFVANQTSLTVPFDELSDGEKCYVIWAVVLAANEAYGPLVCFWDEPDNHLELSEIGYCVMELRRAFQSGGQFIATSHNPETIRDFSRENTLLLYRRNHLEPTQIRAVSEIGINGNLVDALIRGDVEP